jgi:hypothetical protein
LSEDLEDTIRDAAADPASASEDGRSATARSIDELIKADKYLASKAAASGRKTGIRYGKFIPGDAQ